MTDKSTTLIPARNPFIDEKALTIDDILNQIDGRADLTSTKNRDLKSALRSMCRLINKQPDEVPANINWVHIRLRRVQPAAHDITKNRLANIKSDVLKAPEITGCSRKRSDWLRKPSPEWQTLLDKIPDKHDRWKLSQLAQYCSALSVKPNEVVDDHILGLQKTLAQETFANKPDQVAVYAAKTWNRLKGKIEGWPNIELTRPPLKKEPWTIPLEKFPSEFQLDVNSWLNRLANPDPLSSDGPLKPLRPVTIEHRRHQIQQMASALLLTGHKIRQITSLAYLIQIENFKDGVRKLMSRFTDKPTEAIHGLTIGLKSIAAHYVKVDADHLEELRRICQRLNLEVDGLREKNQQRLLQLEDPHNLAKLLHLPEKLVKLSKRSNLHDHKAALLVQAALTIEILLYAPMRINNLASLNIEQHLRRIKVKREDRVQIYIPASEVKNDRALHYELGSQTTVLLDYYLQSARPILLRNPSDFLFPAQNGDRKRNDALSRLIKEMILEHTGLTINAHLFRSIAGKIHSLAAPGDFVTLSHVIGDSLKTAMKSYAQFEQKNSLEHYQRSVDKARSQLLPDKTKHRKSA
jgi:hypothetical protein